MIDLIIRIVVSVILGIAGIIAISLLVIMFRLAWEDYKHQKDEED